MRKVFLEAMISSPSCILLDDFDLLCPSRSSSNATEIQKRIVTCFLSLVDELNSKPSSPVFLIACTSKPLDVDDAAKRAGRIDFEIELSIPTEHDRFDILSFLLQKGNVSMVSTREFLSSSNSSSIYYVLEENIKEISKIAHGMVGADLLQLIKEAFHFCAIRERNTTIEDGKNTEDHKLSNLLGNLSLESKPESEAEETKPATLTSKWIEVTFADFSDALKKVSPSSLREVTVEVPTVRWTDIGGMDTVKQSLKEVIELPLKHPELFKNSGLTPLKGILLYGPPGCSKTLMAKAVATETSMNFLAGKSIEHSEHNLIVFS
jgi:AAA family ATPase